MNRLESTFEELRRAGKKGLIPYITAGDPNPQTTVSIMHELVAAGADILELGVPFSDPMADGPTIQAACERALSHGVRLCDVLDMVSQFRIENDTTPVVLMGYQNPIEVMGIESFAESVAKAGVDGVLTVDLPPEEAVEIAEHYRKQKVAPIFLIAPTTQDSRIDVIAQQGAGFLYYVSFKGVTGANRLDATSVTSKLAQIRQHTKLPVAVGFGIKDAETASAVSQNADAVVIGSALVAQIAAKPHDIDTIKQTVHSIMVPIREALDRMVADKVTA